MLALSALSQALPNASPNAATARPSEGGSVHGNSSGRTRPEQPQTTNPVTGISDTPKTAVDKPAHAAEHVSKPGHSRSDSDEPKDTFRLSDEAQAAVDKLSSRDREVRAHEAAHQSAGGQYAGSASYSYQSGPDGKQYAVGGEVSIDASPVSGDPAATIAKMRQIRSAALAPAQPSGQDRAVAAAAAAMSAQAQAELAAQKAEELDPSEPKPAAGGKAEPSHGSRPPDGISKIDTPEGISFQSGRGGGDKDGPAIDHDDRPTGSLNQILGEIYPGSGSSGHATSAKSSAAGIPDLTAYATNAYRHQTSSAFSHSA